MESGNTSSTYRDAASAAPGAALAVPSTLARAVAAHRQGQLSAARAGYEEILRVAPEHFDALHLLGVIALQEIRTEEGVALIRRALAVNPLNAVAHLNMARGLTDLRRLDDALQNIDRAIELSPGYAEAHSNRGHVLAELGRPAQALTSCNRALELRPDLAIARFGDLGRYLGGASRRRHGETGVDTLALRWLLAVAARPRRQPVVSDRAHF